MILALGMLPTSTSAPSHWGLTPSYWCDWRLWQRERSLRGSPVPCDLQRGHFPTVICRMRCASSFPSWNAHPIALAGTLGHCAKNWAKPRRSLEPTSQSLAGFSQPVGIWGKELGNQSSMTVIFMDTLTNLCAWDMTTISKNIGQYFFCLVLFC